MSSIATHEFFVQLSDPHIVAKGRRLMDEVDTASFLMRAVVQLVAMHHTPSHVLITGDLVERGGLDEYAHLRELLAPLPCPVLLMPGNHDAVPHLREAFADHRYLVCTAHDAALAGFALYEASLGSRRLLALDTVVPGKPYGNLCTARLNGLEMLPAQNASTKTAPKGRLFAQHIGADQAAMPLAFSAYSSIWSKLRYL